MTPAAVIDTHAVVWYLNADARLSTRAKTFIDDAGNQGSTVLVSSISLVEIIYLQEKGRIPLETLTRLETALHAPDTVLSSAALSMEVALSVSQVLRNEVPDMPDRIIAATALHFGVPVISRDGEIKSSAVVTIW